MIAEKNGDFQVRRPRTGADRGGQNQVIAVNCPLLPLAPPHRLTPRTGVPPGWRAGSHLGDDAQLRPALKLELKPISPFAADIDVGPGALSRCGPPRIRQYVEEIHEDLIERRTSDPAEKIWPLAVVNLKQIRPVG
jgi:hypothetical protein